LCSMTEPASSARNQYLRWVEARIEDYKTQLPREELLELADRAVSQLFSSPDGQYPLTEVLLCDVVDALIFRRLRLPSYRRWLRMCHNDTADRPVSGTADNAGQVA
jgi:hypothetical protein